MCFGDEVVISDKNCLAFSRLGSKDDGSQDTFLRLNEESQ